MATFQGRTFTDQRIALDGNEYESCTFKNVTLVYAGGALPAIRNCAFEQFNLAFEGAAENTLAFLRALSGPQSGFRPIVEGTFKAILEP